MLPLDVIRKHYPNLSGEEIEKIKTNGSSWLEPMREWVGSALSCAKIARAKNICSDLAIGAKTVGSNFFLTNQRLVPTFKQGFAELWLESGSQSHLQNPTPKTLSVSRTGFEPVTKSLKGSCSTAELPALNQDKTYGFFLTIFQICCANW